jgi:hypothetical protein
MANWVEGFDPALIAQRMDKIKSIGKDGRASFAGFEHTEQVAILTSMLSLNSEIPEAECAKIINKATFAAAMNGLVTPVSLLKQITLLESDYLRQPTQRFRLVTSASLIIPARPKVFNVNSSRISIGWRPDKKTRTSRADIIKGAVETVSGELPSNYSQVAVTVTGRSTYEAASKAIDDLDLLRGIWNLWKNRHQSFRFSSGPRSPVNTIILGPIHTLHKLNGERATDSWWYELGYRGPVNVWRDTDAIPKMFSFADTFRRHLRRLSYRPEIISALARYSRALDSRDWNYTFLQLWSVLELLTGTTQNDGHKVTVRRASFIFADSDYALQSLLHLRAYRNKAVHAGAEVENIEPLMYQLKRAVEALLSFHAGQSGNFRTMAEAAEFMDSPRDRASIDSKIRKLRAARKYLIA